MVCLCGVLFFLFFVVVIGKFCLVENEVKECIDGFFYKDKFFFEGLEYVEC